MRRGGTPSVETETTSVTLRPDAWTRSQPARRSGIPIARRRSRKAIRRSWPDRKRRRARTAAAQKKSPRPKARRRRTAPSRRSASAKLPAFVEPQLATLVDGPPSGNEWLHEIKYDGYRGVAAVAAARSRIYTRNGLDWTDRFARSCRRCSGLPARRALLDGEIAVADAEGHTDFGALQDALSSGDRRSDLLPVRSAGARRRRPAQAAARASARQKLRDLLERRRRRR